MVTERVRAGGVPLGGMAVGGGGGGKALHPHTAAAAVVSLSLSYAKADYIDSNTEEGAVRWDDWDGDGEIGGTERGKQAGVWLSSLSPSVVSTEHPLFSHYDVTRSSASGPTCF